jgi:hypothetical protein
MRTITRSRESAFSGRERDLAGNEGFLFREDAFFLNRYISSQLSRSLDLGQYQIDHVAERMSNSLGTGLLSWEKLFSGKRSTLLKNVYVFLWMRSIFSGAVHLVREDVRLLS